MKIARVWGVFFSPAGTTKKVTEEITEVLAEHLKAEKRWFDYTLPAARAEQLCFDREDLVVFGMPVYAGRVPNKILPCIQNVFCGNGCLAVPVAVFGNRHYDDALAELSLELDKNGFQVIAAAAAAARHVFSETLAAGRPDAEDFHKIKSFAAQTAAKILAGSCFEELKCPEIPGENPPQKYYTPKGIDGKPAVFLKAKPVINQEACTKCGVCVSVCPMGSIKQERQHVLSVPEITGICIKCQACVRMCRQNAVAWKDPAYLSHKQMLEETFAERKEPEFYL